MNRIAKGMSLSPSKRLDSGVLARVALALWCIALFVAGFLLYTRYNTFPVEFHPDESPKAAKILQGRPSYRQPLLFNTAVTVAARLTHRASSVREVVLTGRVVSAFFAGGAVVLLALLAYVVNAQSLPAAMSVGIATLSCPQLLLLAHYMKEDTALVFAGAAFLVAAWHDQNQPTTRSAALLGIASAVMASSKYIGLAAMPVALWLIAGRHRSDKRRSVRSFAFGLVLSWCAINYLVFANPGGFLGSLWYEAAHPVAGHYGLVDGILLSSPVWRILAAEINPVVAGLAAIFLVLSLLNRDRVPQVVVLLVVGAGVYLGCLSVSRFVLDRHVLPVTLAVYVMAGFATVQIAQLTKARWIVIPILSFAVAVSALSPARAIFHELQNETRVQLRAWIRNNLPPYAIIAQDKTAHLQGLRQKVVSPPDLFVTDVGSIADLRAKGITHVVTCDEAYARLFTRHPTKGRKQDYDRRRARYEEIFRTATLLFEAKPVRPVGGNTSPVVRVYTLPQSG